MQVIMVFNELTEIEVAEVPSKVTPIFAELPAKRESKLVPVMVTTPPNVKFIVADAVAADDKTKEVSVTIDTTVAPSGTPTPDTTCPTIIADVTPGTNTVVLV